jgi:hypothetical protein
MQPQSSTSAKRNHPPANLSQASTTSSHNIRASHNTCHTPLAATRKQTLNSQQSPRLQLAVCRAYLPVTSALP